MRRVLFGTGYPQSVPVVAAPTVNPDDCLEILDLRDLSDELQQHTRFVTLYARQITATSFVDVYVQEGNETPFIVASMRAPDDVDEAVPDSCTIQIRGNVRLFATSVVTVAAIVGYYELDSETPSIEVQRPLQPSDPISPFNVVPLFVAEESVAVVMHSFEENYVDTLTIDYAIAVSEATDDTELTFPNGVVLKLPAGNAFNKVQYHFLSGIPMIADDEGQQITVSTEEGAEAVLSGTFVRS